MRLSPLKLEVWDGRHWETLIDKNMPLGEWAHIAVVFGADGTMTAFLDRIRQLSSRGGFDFDGVEAGIGARALGTYGACLTGSIDDFRVYGTALSDEQIRSLVTPKLLTRADHIMMHYPAEAAVAYLDFFDVTREKRCFEAARKIADTYRKLQLANGTWYQMMDNDTGKPLFDNFLVPSTVILFLDRLNRQYGLTEYEVVKHRAMEWIMANTMKTFNWQSQFEDGQPNQPYQSLAHAQACEWATYLLTHPDDYPNSLSMALELIRFAEDQFVIWEKQPLDITLNDQLEPLSSKYWVTPCVAEQHQYWMPVNFSASLMVQCYLEAYEVTGNKLYRAKAEDVANALLVVQEMHNGEYPTYLLRPTSTGEFERAQNIWINCGVYTARSVLAPGKALSKGAPGARRNAR